MADSKRQKIVSAVIAAMEGILVASGYETDIGSTVGDWQTNWQDAQLPALSVCDLTEEVLESSPDEAYDLYGLPVQIRAFLKTGTRAADARKIIADVLKAVKNNQTWVAGGVKLAHKTVLKRSGLIPDEEAFKLAAVAVEIEIQYYTERFNAYQ